jgi:AmiR/NasT family two-component response regulator
MKQTPHFTGLKVTILHREDTNTEKLVRQLRLLGMHTTLQWSPIKLTDLPDVIVVDADQGWDELLPFEAETAPRPVVALLASEAPGRISWALSKGAGAVIAKPVAASAVYPALVMAFSIQQEREEARSRISHLEERVRMRPLVHAAVERLMAAQGVDEEHAYRTLRTCAMQRRLPMEQVAAFILAGAEPLPKAI